MPTYTATHSDRYDIDPYQGHFDLVAQYPIPAEIEGQADVIAILLECGCIVEDA